MKRITFLLFSFLFLYCGFDDNPYDPSSSLYVSPYFEIDSTKTTVFEGDSITVDSVLITVIGNRDKNQFRWQLDSLEWSTWAGENNIEYQINMYSIDTGWHSLQIQTCYSPNSNTFDSTISFYKSSVDFSPSDFIKDSLILNVYENNLLDINIKDSCFMNLNLPLTFSLIESPLDNDSLYSSGKYTFLAGYEDSGISQVVATVKSDMYSDTFFLNISVINTNRPPVFLDSLPKSLYLIDEGKNLSIKFKATDEDEDNLNFFIEETNLPQKVECTLTDSMIEWQSQVNDNGAYYLKLSVTDNIDTATISIDIGVGNVNLPPQLIIGKFLDGNTIQAKEKDTLKFTVDVFDPNKNDKVTLKSAKNLPFETSSNGIGGYDTATGNFWFLPLYEVSSQQRDTMFTDIIFYAVDSSGLEDSLVVNISVENTNRPPSALLISPNNGETGVAKNNAFKWSAVDPDGDSLTFSLFLGTISGELEMIYQGRDTIYNNQNLFENGQTYLYKLKVSDGIDSGLSITRKFIINEGFLEWVLNGDVIMISLKATVWPFSLLIWGL